MSLSSSIPLEWPASWRDPALLKLLDDGPINTLLLPAGAVPEIRAAAGSRKLECPAPVAWCALKEVDWRSGAGLVAISDGVWPDLALKSQSNSAGDVSGGPTGAPWLDANGWALQLARCRAAGRPVWIKAPAPENPATMSFSTYLLAACEAAAYGARRPVWLAPQWADGLAQANASALADWRRLMQTMRWLEEHRAWDAWSTLARLAVVSDFSGANEYNASEVLNLSARRNLAFVPVEKAKITAADLKSRRAVLYVDAGPMPAPVVALVQKFVETGGLLLSMKEPAAAIKGVRPSREQHPRFTLFDCGKGRVAVSKAEWEDQYVLAQDTHLLMSRRHDAIRLFNGGSITCYQTQSADGRKWLAHLMNYAGRMAAHQVSLQTWQAIKSARVYNPEKQAPVDLEIHRDPGQQEVYLPSFSVYCAVELELTNHA
ncbi:hypothetical protein [uncultured Paludibaculum sp.]|uniref:hypothetical protein n=1 Tax=uncultured Paludibaculum sp. TaxID=1765020 RepID=UPI002AAB1DE6|nr:hypothetical protein [uncultured Paludibaculum sp.]